MALLEKKLASGETLKMSTPEWGDACALKNAVFAVLGAKASELFATKADGASAAVLTLLSIAFSSPEIEKAMWSVLKTARYGSAAVNEGLFDDNDGAAREDYFEIMKEAALFTLLPFFKNRNTAFAINLSGI